MYPIVYGSKFRSDATDYGKVHEEVAIARFKESRPNVTIKKSGIFIYKNNPYLAATPDGLFSILSILYARFPPNGHVV